MSGCETVGSRIASDRSLELRLPHVMSRDELVIGRADDRDYVVDDPTVSRHHAELHRPGGEWQLRDAASTNGSRINGWRVDTATDESSPP